MPFARNLHRYNPGNPESGSAILHRQIGDFGSHYPISYYIHHGALSDARDEILEGVVWADFDHRGRLICAAEGKLYAVGLATNDKSREWREIADFNANTPHPLASPDSAKVW